MLYIIGTTDRPPKIMIGKCLDELPPRKALSLKLTEQILARFPDNYLDALQDAELMILNIVL